MTTPELKARTKEFALRVIRLVRALPDDRVARPIASQLIRSGTSVASNYRAACLGRSKKDFTNKLGIVAEESDESALWLELIIADEILPPAKVTPLLEEASELTAIMLASIKTARSSDQQSNLQSQI